MGCMQEKTSRAPLGWTVYLTLLFGLYLDRNREPLEGFKVGCDKIRSRVRISNDYFIGIVEIRLEKAFWGLSCLKCLFYQTVEQSVLFLFYIGLSVCKYKCTYV